MQSISFSCEVITPMFLAGADGRTPELRPPSIKGAMRFWWRALHGHLPLSDLKQQEGQIFGDTQGRSIFNILTHVVHEKDIKKDYKSPVPHKDRGFTLPCIMPGSTFEVHFRFPGKHGHWNLDKTAKLFELVTLLGGFGKRVRRGMGSVDIIESSDPKWKKKPASLEHIFELISSFTPHYALREDDISLTFSGGMQYYPWIRQIEMGKPNSRILKDISDIMHHLHANRDWRVYEASLGYASRGARFASPIYVSVVKGSEKAVITSLNTIPDKQRIKDISLRLQSEFKDEILKS